MDIEEEERTRQIRKAVGLRIKSARQDRNLSQLHLAELIDGDQRSVSQYENGTVDMPITRLMDVAAALGCDAGWLLTGHDPNAPPLAKTLRRIAEMVELGKLNIDGK